ncbi:MAG: type I DNA topoisomerase [Phycisphaerales bacterium]|nr:type I DNA topoisomerase [Phycisphaerales bacterium]
MVKSSNKAGPAKRSSGTSGKTAGKSKRSPSAKGKHLVIVESPAKARTINRYLGPDYIVKASVGHVRDLPSKAPKGEAKEHPVPGVDLENDFAPTYDVMPGKKTTVAELKRLAKQAEDVWFATDLDREGEAIAWHLAQLLGVDTGEAKRVVFNAITQRQIQQAFEQPHSLDEGKFNAYQARRVLDRIVGYQVSPLLWKKVARGLSAGRVQSVAVRVVVERERAIRAFVPEEYWQLAGCYSIDPPRAGELGEAWRMLLEQTGNNGRGPSIKERNRWLASNQSVRAQLVSVDGKKAEKLDESACLQAAARAGMRDIQTTVREDPKAKGPAKRLVQVAGTVDHSITARVKSIETKRTSSRPPAPFITSTLQQAASTRLGFGARRTMRAAQHLYEGMALGSAGSVGLITYMRTDSTHLSGDAVDVARSLIAEQFGQEYLPAKPNFYTSSNKQAQEAHEAIRPTNLDYPPSRVKSLLPRDEYRLYELIWNRFIACQMTPAKWDATTVLLAVVDDQGELVFKAAGRMLVFDGFYRVAGVPVDSDEQTLPGLKEGSRLAPFALDAKQNFTSPPSRFTEASLIRTLESEGIGRPSTYASIIQVIQDRNYVEQIERRLYATDLGEVVTDKLVEAFPNILDIGYTREMELELDQIAECKLDWVRMMHDFYGPFSRNLAKAEENLTHAKAETQPAPDQYRCDECGAPTVYRFGKSGRFMSCSRYPDCSWASPINREGEPVAPENVDVACVKCGSPMQLRKGRFGAFLGCTGYPECDGILKLDKAGHPIPPAVPPLETDMPCAKCGNPLVLRHGKRGPWLACSTYPKCRGRGAWAKLEPDIKATWQAALDAHLQVHPIAIIHDLQGAPLTDSTGKPIPRDNASDGVGQSESESEAVGSAESAA